MNETSVVIDDDDVIMVDSCEIIDIDGKDEIQSNTKKTIDTIVIDEDYTTAENSENTINNDKEKTFARLLKNNILMNKIAEHCLSMANNAGMSRVINKTLQPLYKDADNTFKESESFSKILTKILHNLKHDPDHKFLHIKSLCEELKAGKYRRKVPFVTLTTDIRKNPTRSCGNRLKGKFKKFKMDKIAKRNNMTDVIEIDNSDNESVITLNDDEDNDINESDNNDDIMIVDDIGNSDVRSEESNKENTVVQIENYNENETSPDDLLVPHNSVSVKKHYHEQKTAFAIEQQIEVYKCMVKDLEEKEVHFDSLLSPYILCDRYKAKILELYKRLCKITGNGDGNLMKQRVVRLRVVEGHPPGPVKRLERFLNSTIDETGSVPLPDFHDVVRCVKQSNIADNLGWSKQEIMREAIALFTHCGHALRKQRQKREYKDLMSLVRDKEIDDDDPAAEDPQLLARLEENKLIAKANEEELINKYVRMQYMPRNSALFKQQQCNMDIMKSAEDSDTDSDSDSDSDLTHKKKVKTKLTPARPIPNRRESSVITDKINEANQSVNSNNEFNGTSVIQNDSTVQNSINSAIETCLSAVQHSINTTVDTSVNTTQNSPNTTAETFTNGILYSPNTTAETFTNGIQCSPNMTAETSRNALQYSVNNIKVENSVNPIHNPLPTERTTNTIQCPSNTTTETSRNTIEISRNATVEAPETIIQTCSNTTTAISNEIKLNTLQKIGVSNRYVISYNSDSIQDNSPPKVVDTNLETPQIKENVTVKLEPIIKQEPVDIQSLFDRLGDNYIATIFDIEDPFLIIEVSDSSDDEDL